MFSWEPYWQCKFQSLPERSDSGDLRSELGIRVFLKVLKWFWQSSSKLCRKMRQINYIFRVTLGKEVFIAGSYSFYSHLGLSVSNTTLLNLPTMLKIPLEMALRDGPLETFQAAGGRRTHPHPHLLEWPWLLHSLERQSSFFGLLHSLFWVFLW